MNKSLVKLVTLVGMTIGGAVPMLFGDTSLLDGWTLLGTFIGGVLGVWAGLKLGRRY